MTLDRMALASYRCFDERQDIELRPVTVILGRNNSGKSALVRAPRVLETGIRADSPAPLDADVLGEEMLGSFVDLVYGSRPHGSLDAELWLGAGTGRLRIAAKVQNIDELHTQIVSFLELESGGDLVRFEWDQSELRGDVGRYTVEHGANRMSDIPVAFQGLLPGDTSESPLPAELRSLLAGTSRAVRDNYPAIRYFGPFRDRPQRRYRLPARMPVGVGTSGEYAVGILASDVARRRGQLVAQINEGLADQISSWELDVVEWGGMFSVVIKSRHDTSLSVNLADAGTGIAQELPIFVQRAMDALDPPKHPVLEIIEQPELHLHPAAHAALADLYLQAARDTRVRFIIETHSETLLLRLRRRIAEGDYDPADLAIYFVDHQSGAATVHRVNVGEDGGLDYWPAGVFSEDYDEARAIASAQLARRDAGAR